MFNYSISDLQSSQNAILQEDISTVKHKWSGNLLLIYCFNYYTQQINHRLKFQHNFKSG